jgi:hypothetical protein
MRLARRLVLANEDRRKTSRTRKRKPAEIIFSFRPEELKMYRQPTAL